jgi:hypothetical protein
MDKNLIPLDDLPNHIKDQVNEFISFLLSKEGDATSIKKRKFGALKSKIKMQEDFDLPLTDFDAYMQ